jgi:hypothetical protein
MTTTLRNPLTLRAGRRHRRAEPGIEVLEDVLSPSPTLPLPPPDGLPAAVEFVPWPTPPPFRTIGVLAVGVVTHPPNPC